MSSKALNLSCEPGSIADLLLQGRLRYHDACVVRRMAQQNCSAGRICLRPSGDQTLDLCYIYWFVISLITAAQLINTSYRINLQHIQS